MAQVLKSRYDLVPVHVFAVLNNITRREILKALSWDDLAYSQLQDISLKYSNLKTKYTKNLVAHHVRVLKKFHLIGKSTKKTYFLTFRGSRIIKAIKILEESEMFICDV